MDTEPDRPKFVVVCTANICRSPMAEALLRNHLEMVGVGATVLSSGHLPAGTLVSNNSVAVMADLLLDISGRRSVTTSAEVINESAIILRATDPDPQRAVRTANAVEKEYVKFCRQQSIKDLVDASSEMQTKVDGCQAQIDGVNVKLADRIDGAEPMASTLKARRDGLVRPQQNYQARIDGLGVDAALKTGGASVPTAALESSAPIAPRPVRPMLR